MVSRRVRVRVHGVAGEKIAPEIIRVSEEHLPVHGARKVWRQLRREGFRVTCCTVERFMRALSGWTGLATVGSSSRSTTFPPTEFRQTAEEPAVTPPSASAERQDAGVLGLRTRRSRPFPAAYLEMYYRQQPLAEGEGFKEPAEVEIGMAGRRGPCGKRARSHRHAHPRTPADLDPAQGL